MTARFGLRATSQVVEIASNDGYLLQYFKQKNIPVLGIEPAANVAKVAQAKGIPTLVKFFGVDTAKELLAQGKTADLLLGNNVLAHVPDLNDFVAGMKILLKPGGVITMEFPHLLRLMQENQFDTIYHEHFSYFSFMTVEKVFARHGLTPVRRRRTADARRLAAHLRAAHGRRDQARRRRVALLEREEPAAGSAIETYVGFAEQVKRDQTSCCWSS